MAADILVVDDEADIRTLIAGILNDEGYQARAAGNSTTALDAVRQRRPNLVVLDIWLQGSELDGLQLLDVIKREHPGLPVLMISGHGNVETAVAAMKLGAFHYIEKPFKADHLLLLVQRAIEDAKLRREHEDLRSKVGGEFELLGSSSGIAGVRQAIDRVGPTNSRVLVSGPPGVGKEIVARSIHQRSRRAAGPFIVLNCATMAPDHLETEMFGVETGVNAQDRPVAVGSFERAHGGTLLIDEVADMALETQGKLVRALQDQAFERIGGSTRVNVDVRVIASTNRNLPAAMTEGRFRQDLFYRLNVVPIAIAPLRDRREDIPILARHFVARAVELNGLPLRTLADDAVALMMAYDWPGNVRELRNFIERLLIMAPGNPGDVVRADMMPQDIGAISQQGGLDDLEYAMMTVPLREAREIFERRYLEAQLTRFDSNVARMATFIGMERSALYRKLRSLGINTQDKPAEAEG
ncbi:MAG: sigma-54-dependent transcriptional regulator [Dongiaceae bacterium]